MAKSLSLSLIATVIASGSAMRMASQSKACSGLCGRQGSEQITLTVAVKSRLSSAHHTHRNSHSRLGEFLHHQDLSLHLRAGIAYIFDSRPGITSSGTVATGAPNTG